MYGGPSSAPSNKYGWLQTFRSCMSMLLTVPELGPRTLPTAKDVSKGREEDSAGNNEGHNPLT